MNDAQLQGFRAIADQLIGRADWEWVGPHASQRMFGITRARAEGYAAAHGGTARPMRVPVGDVPCGGCSVPDPIRTLATCEFCGGTGRVSGDA